MKWTLKATIKFWRIIFILTNEKFKTESKAFLCSHCLGISPITLLEFATCFPLNPGDCPQQLMWLIWIHTWQQCLRGFTSPPCLVARNDGTQKPQLLVDRPSHLVSLICRLKPHVSSQDNTVGFACNAMMWSTVVRATVDKWVFPDMHYLLWTYFKIFLYLPRVCSHLVSLKHIHLGYTYSAGLTSVRNMAGAYRWVAYRLKLPLHFLHIYKYLINE